LTTGDDGHATKRCDACASDLDVIVVVRAVITWRHASWEDIDDSTSFSIPVDILSFPAGVSAILRVLATATSSVVVITLSAFTAWAMEIPGHFHHFLSGK